MHALCVAKDCPRMQQLGSKRYFATQYARYIHRDFDRQQFKYLWMMFGIIRSDWLYVIYTVLTRRAISIGSLWHFRCFSHF